MHLCFVPLLPRPSQEMMRIIPLSSTLCWSKGDRARDKYNNRVANKQNWDVRYADCRHRIPSSRLLKISTFAFETLDTNWHIKYRNWHIKYEMKFLYGETIIMHNKLFAPFMTKLIWWWLKISWNHAIYYWKFLIEGQFFG